MLHQILLHYVTRSCIQCNKKAHRRGQERTSRRASAEVFSTAGNPLPTSSDAGANLRELMERMGHSSTKAALRKAKADKADTDAQGDDATSSTKASGTKVARRRGRAS